MVQVRTETPAQVRRREAVENARAIVGFAGGSVSQEMEALQERFISGELTTDEVIAERLRQCSLGSCLVGAEPAATKVARRHCCRQSASPHNRFRSPGAGWVIGW